MTVLERKEREFKRREEDILAAALSLFDRDDWQAVTIDEIAAKAEIGKGTVYKHFESKDQIYARLVLDFNDVVVNELRKIDFTRPPLEILGAAMDLFWRMHAGSPEHKRLMRYCSRKEFYSAVGEKLGSELERKDEEIMALLVPVIERGIREGAIVEAPVEHIMLTLHAAMVGLMEMDEVECVETNLTPEQKYGVVKSFALRGIAKR